MELIVLWRWATSAVVCSLCSWRHTLRLLTEPFRVSKVSFSDWRSLSIFCLSRSTLLSRVTTKLLILVATLFNTVSIGGKTSVGNCNHAHTHTQTHTHTHTHTHTRTHTRTRADIHTILLYPLHELCEHQVNDHYAEYILIVTPLLHLLMTSKKTLLIQHDCRKQD